MSTTVEIYLKYPGDIASLAQRVAVGLDVPGYFYTTGSCVYALDSRPWAGVAGTARGTLDRADGDPDEPTAFTPYDYELSLELREAPGLARGELGERLARAIFDRLTGLGYPLAYGDADYIYADFLPGRGVRDLPTDTDWSEPGRDTWFEPRLHGAPGAAAPPPAEPPPSRGRVTVFEVDGLLQLVPMTPADRAVPPAISARTGIGPALLGRALLEALARSAGDDGAAGDADPWAWVTGQGRVSPEEYARDAVSVRVELAGGRLGAVPHGRYEGGPTGRVVPGPAIEPLAARESGPWNDKAVGELILRLVSAVRDNAYT